LNGYLSQVELKIIFCDESDLIGEQQAINIIFTSDLPTRADTQLFQEGKSSEREWCTAGTLTKNLFVKE